MLIKILNTVLGFSRDDILIENDTEVTFYFKSPMTGFNRFIFKFKNKELKNDFLKDFYIDKVIDGKIENFTFTVDSFKEFSNKDKKFANDYIKNNTDLDSIKDQLILLKTHKFTELERYEIIFALCNGSLDNIRNLLLAKHYTNFINSLI